MMLTSVPGTFKRGHGFTLIEMMLVMLVIGISLAMIVPNLSKNPEQVLLEEGNRLTALLNYATDISIATGSAIAWDQTAAGYRFLERDQDLKVWKPLMNDSSLRERTLPEDAQIEYVAKQGKQAGNLARVIMNPSGVQAPFEIGLHNESAHIKVVGNLIGQIKMIRVER